MLLMNLPRCLCAKASARESRGRRHLAQVKTLGPTGAASPPRAGVKPGQAPLRAGGTGYPGGWVPPGGRGRPGAALPLEVAGEWRGEPAAPAASGTGGTGRLRQGGRPRGRAGQGSTAPARRVPAAGGAFGVRGASGADGAARAPPASPAPPARAMRLP